MFEHISIAALCFLCLLQYWYIAQLKTKLDSFKKLVYNVKVDRDFNLKKANALDQQVYDLSLELRRLRAKRHE